MGMVQTLGIIANQDKTISSFPGGGPSMTGTCWTLVAELVCGLRFIFSKKIV